LFDRPKPTTEEEEEDKKNNNLNVSAHTKSHTLTSRNDEVPAFAKRTFYQTTNAITVKSLLIKFLVHV
jgi:hypothetical protein